MPYYVYRLQRPYRLELLDYFSKYREARAFARAHRAGAGDVESIRMIFAQDELAAEALLLAPRDERVIGED